MTAVETKVCGLAMRHGSDVIHIVDGKLKEKRATEAAAEIVQHTRDKAAAAAAAATHSKLVLQSIISWFHLIIVQIMNTHIYFFFFLLSKVLKLFHKILILCKPNARRTRKISLKHYTVHCNTTTHCVQARRTM